MVVLMVTFPHTRRSEWSADDRKRFLSDGRFIVEVKAKQRGEFDGGGVEVGRSFLLSFFSGGVLERTFAYVW